MKSLIIYILLLAVALFSCHDDYPKNEQKLVIEGWIENGEFPVVLVGLSGNIDNDGNDIADFMVRWAKATINDGDSTYILLGRPDERYFPPFIYTSYDFRGEVGKSYTLEVEYNDMKVSAKTTIPTPVEIGKISVEEVENEPYMRSINVTLPSSSLPQDNDDGNKTHYFRLRYRDHIYETRFYPSFLGTFCTTSNNQDITIPLYRAKRKTTMEYTPYFYSGSTVEVRLGHITEESYHIWTDYDNMVNFGSNIFFKQQTELRSNIIGGYGHWIGYGISKRQVFLP